MRVVGGSLRFDPPLVPGRLVRRHQRFLADVALDDGRVVVAHCTNTGRMTGCATPGSRVYLSRSDNPRRRLPFTWELVRAGRVLVGINTLVPNRLIHAALKAGKIKEFHGYNQIAREVRAPGGSRLDLALQDRRGRRCFVEIKSVTLAQGRLARFPDAVTSRGLRHLRELARLARDGHRAVILFLVQRADCEAVTTADEIDPLYGKTLRRVVPAGVEPLAYRARVRSAGIGLDRRLPVVL
jgi:sugar fermentation stimulation protein A